MKILDVVEFSPWVERDGEHFWHTKANVLGDMQPGVYLKHIRFHHTCLEWRIAEYAMDPNDIDSVLHLLLHEHLLSWRTEVTCYTPGYSQQEALTHRLGQIQEHIDRHAARMSPAHAKMVKHEPHKHPMLDPVREQGTDPEFLHIRRLHVQGCLLKVGGNHKKGNALIREASMLSLAKGKRGA